jgi:hypothetical protein
MFGTGVDWSQKTSAAISFIKATEHRDIAEKASHYFEKPSIQLKICLKSLAIPEKP